MKKKWLRIASVSLAAVLTATSFAGCGGKGRTLSTEKQEANVADLAFPLKEKATISGLTSYPANTESDPNNRTIFKRLQEKTNVQVDWNAIQSDQWGDKITLEMSNTDTLPDFVFTADFGDSDLLKYADQGLIVSLEDYISEYMPNLSSVFEQYPEYKTMCTDENGHIWAFPWIEQLGSEKEAIQTVGDISYINKKWLDFLGLQVPTTVDEFEQVLLSFKENAAKLQQEFGIEGDIIPMGCIMNDGDQDPSILINGFGEGYGDNDKDRHIAVTDEGEVICTATQDGYKKGIEWLNKLYSESLIDTECFTQDWSTYVSKGKAGRYGVCFSWDVANIDNLEDWVPFGALTADTKNITPQNGSFTSGFNRGKCVVTAACEQIPLVCAWIDQMYDPMQSAQDNWGTYGEEDGFDIFEMSKNAEGGDMLKHADLGDESPVEVRDAEFVGGPLAVLDDYYDKYVTCPDDAAYRLDWIKNIYTPDMNGKYVYPNVFMNREDTEALSQLQTDLKTCINTHRSDWVMNGGIEEGWDAYMKELDSYKIGDYLTLLQKYFDDYQTANADAGDTSAETAK